MSVEVNADDRRRKQRSKNIVVALALIGFVVLVFFVSIVRMGGA
ncbi:MAG: hypothetical protein R3C97_12110 [Geminicoccaceae bacterium]